MKAYSDTEQVEDSGRFDVPEFFNLYVYISVLLFAANNFWFKYSYHNWLTGKLSDFTFCFFFPLYLSAVTSIVGVKWGIETRVILGAIITSIAFFLVKVSTFFSDILNTALSPFSYLIFGRESINFVDYTDLVALSSAFFAILFCKRFDFEKQ